MNLKLLYLYGRFGGILLQGDAAIRKTLHMDMNESNLLIKSARFAGLDDVRKSLIDISLSYCGIQQCSPLHNNGPEIRDTSFLHIVLSGKGTFQIEGEVFSLRANDAFFIPNGISAQYTADRYDPWKYMWVGFSGLMSFDVMTLAGFSKQCPVRHMATVSSEMYSYIEGMIDAYRLTSADEFRRNGFFFHFISDLIDGYHDQKAAGEVGNHQCYLYAHQAYDYIMRNFAKKICISSLADTIGISRSHLFTCFKKTYQISPKQFLDQVRMEHAASMLISKKLYISEIARNVGYDDELAFSKAFKCYFDRCPTDFRKLNNA